ncbi:MAG: hypothetical protein ABL930_13110, partial [Pseudobdellovibrio sp.]
MKSNIRAKTANFSLSALIILTLLSQKGLAKQTEGGSDRGGGDAAVIQANITAAHRQSLNAQLVKVFSNTDQGVLSLKNYILYFFKRIDLVKSNEVHKILTDMKSRQVEALIQNKLVYKVSGLCVDKNNLSKSATAAITTNPPSSPEVCVNPNKIISDLGTNITDSALVGIVVHELSHFYGYEDADHSLATAAAETMRTLSREEDRTLVQLEAAALSDRGRLTSMPKTNCDIPIETNVTSSPCNPLEWAQLVDYRDIYTKSVVNLLTRQVTVSPFMLAAGHYSRKKIQLGSGVGFAYSTGQQLGVIRQEKIKIIGGSVGIDSSILGETITDRQFGLINDIYSTDPTKQKEAIEKLERENDLAFDEVFENDLREFMRKATDAEKEYILNMNLHKWVELPSIDENNKLIVY